MIFDKTNQAHLPTARAEQRAAMHDQFLLKAIPAYVVPDEYETAPDGTPILDENEQPILIKAGYTEYHLLSASLESARFMLDQTPANKAAAGWDFAALGFDIENHRAELEARIPATPPADAAALVGAQGPECASRCYRR